MATVEQIAQAIFDQTPPLRDGAGRKVTIPFEMWRDDTRAHFLTLARLSLVQK